MGDTPHSMVLQALLLELGIHAKGWDIRVLPMHRVQVGEGRSQVADICVMAGDLPLHEALRMPPLLCVEIVSPEDGASVMSEKIEEYLDAGVRTAWTIDPRRRKAYEMTMGGERSTATQLTVPGTDILIYVSDVFSQLHELEPDGWRASVLKDGKTTFG